MQTEKMRYVKGQELMVVLQEECFLGNCNGVASDGSRICLNNVVDFQTGKSIPGVQFFYKSDIQEIKILKNENNKCSSESSITSDVSNSCQTDNEYMTILSMDEIKQVENQAKGCIFITQTDYSYHNACKDLKTRKLISVHLETSRMGRYSRTSILSVFSGEQVYIFDILSLGRIYPELKSILESQSHVKIVFDGRKMADNLKHKQNTNLCTVFDCLVAYIATQHNKCAIDFNQCVNRCMNLPENFLINTKINWDSRPFDDNRKYIAAKQVILIHKLYDHLLHKCMLREFYNNCINFVNCYADNMDSVNVASDMSLNQSDSVDQIKDVDLNFDLNIDDINDE